MFIWDIKSTVIARDGGQFGNGNGRGNLLEIEIDDTDTIYAFDDQLTEESGDLNNNRAFHEPFYIVKLFIYMLFSRAGYGDVNHKRDRMPTHLGFDPGRVIKLTVLFKVYSNFLYIAR